MTDHGRNCRNVVCRRCVHDACRLPCDSCGAPAFYGRSGMWWCSECWQRFGPWREPDGSDVVELPTAPRTVGMRT